MGKSDLPPLDKWLDEPRDIEYDAMVIKDGEPRKERVKERVFEKVKYTKAPAKRFSCAPGKHQYFMKDLQRHIAKCSSCSKHKFLFASSQTIRDGHIIDRLTGQIFD